MYDKENERVDEVELDEDGFEVEQEAPSDADLRKIEAEEAAEQKKGVFVRHVTHEPYQRPDITVGNNAPTDLFGNINKYGVVDIKDEVDICNPYKDLERTPLFNISLAGSYRCTGVSVAKAFIKDYDSGKYEAEYLKLKYCLGDRSLKSAYAGAVAKVKEVKKFDCDTKARVVTDEEV